MASIMSFYLKYGVWGGGSGVQRIEFEARGGAWADETPSSFVSCNFGMSGRLEAFKDKTGWRHGDTQGVHCRPPPAEGGVQLVTRRETG